MPGMKRRDFITLLGGAAAWPLTGRAQPAMPVIGYFSGRSPGAEAPIRVPFLKALEGSGFAAGRNVAIEYRFAEGQDERLPELAALSACSNITAASDIAANLQNRRVKRRAEGFCQSVEIDSVRTSVCSQTTAVPKFITIQICPKDWLHLHRQAPDASNRPRLAVPTCYDRRRHLGGSPCPA